MDRKTAIFLNGGAGRMVSSIPAVEKYLEENINLKTKRLAKKQITWFKKEPKLHMIETDNVNLVYNSMMEIING